MAGKGTEALNRLKAGDIRAEAEIDRQFRGALLEFVRKRRSQGLRARIDTDGVVNAALKSFLSGVYHAEFPELASSQDIQRVLLALVDNILTDEQRFHLRQKRTPHREQACPEGRPVDEPAATATPEQFALANDLLEQILETVRDLHPMAMEMMELRLQGRGTKEIAERLGLGLRYTQVTFRLMREACRQAGLLEN